MLNNSAKDYALNNQLKLVHSVKHTSSINDLYVPQTNGEISPSIMQNWTLQAIECFEINSDCTKCSLRNGNYSFICQMPKIVNALIKTYGPPQKEFVEE